MTTEEEVPAPLELQQLPRELLLHLTLYLDPTALLRLSETSRCFASVANDEHTWRSIYKRSFRGRQRISLPASSDDLHYLVDLGGQPELLATVKPGLLVGMLRERRKRGLIPGPLLPAVDLACENLDIGELKKAALDTFPAFLAPSKQPTDFSSVWKLATYCFVKDLTRTHITPFELCATSFEVSFRSPSWLGFPEEPRPRLTAVHNPDGTMTLDGHPLRWRFLGDSEDVSPSRWFSRQARHHARAIRRVQTEHYAAKHVSRTSDGGWVLHNAQVIYLSVEMDDAMGEKALLEQQGTGNGQGVDPAAALNLNGDGVFGSGPGMLFAQEVAKVLAVHAAVVFGFGFVVAWLF